MLDQPAITETPTQPPKEDKPEERKEPTIEELSNALTNATAEVGSAKQLMIAMGKLQEAARQNVTRAIQWQRNAASRVKALPEGLRETTKQMYDTCWNEMHAKLSEISEELQVIDLDVDSDEEIAF